MSIVDPSVLELLNHADSRYTLVVEASKRGREIVNGALPMIDAEGMKPLVRYPVMCRLPRLMRFG